MSNTICSSNITSGFIDLATYDELEKYMYGCGDAVAYFVRTTCKSTWFTQVPVILSNASGQAEFGRTWSVSISRAGDYLLQTWLRIGLPEVRMPDTTFAGRVISCTTLSRIAASPSMIWLRRASTTTTSTSGRHSRCRPASRLRTTT